MQESSDDAVAPPDAPPPVRVRGFMSLLCRVGLGAAVGAALGAWTFGLVGMPWEDGLVSGAAVGLAVGLGFGLTAWAFFPYHKGL